MKKIGIVVIGRNEGNRLIHCLKTLKKQLSSDTPVVYVDSGSSDDSLEFAKSLGVDTIELDPSKPFTMARGRNTGFDYLVKHHELEYVQFVDGDCELVEGWLGKAVEAFQSYDQPLAIVCGRRRERFPKASVYNLLADIEWNKPVGEVKACGGDSLVKVKAIQEVGGFNASLICGEEPEMCIRLRQKGWKILRIDTDMTLHDAAITNFYQWWMRSIRAGWAGAQGMIMYGLTSERYKIRECLRCWLWGPFLIALSVILFSFKPNFGFLTLLIYPLQILRSYWQLKKYKLSVRKRFACSFLFTLIKFPHVVGQTKYFINNLRGSKATLIEYKSHSVV